jgi:uncharacterized protein
MSGPHHQWRAALAEGRLMLPRETATGQCFFPPAVGAPESGGAWDWVEASGRGTVHSVSIVRPRPPEAPYNVVLVDLEEGPRLMSRVEGISAEAVTIGMTVIARIDRSNGEPILLFDPA